MDVEHDRGARPIDEHVGREITVDDRGRFRRRRAHPGSQDLSDLSRRFSQRHRRFPPRAAVGSSPSIDSALHGTEIGRRPLLERVGQPVAGIDDEGGSMAERAEPVDEPRCDPAVDRPRTVAGRDRFGHRDPNGSKLGELFLTPCRHGGVLDVFEDEATDENRCLLTAREGFDRHPVDAEGGANGGGRCRPVGHGCDGATRGDRRPRLCDAGRRCATFSL